MKTLVAIPYKDGLHPALYARMIELSNTLIEATPDCDLALYCNHGRKLDTDGPFAPHARARNELLARHLTPEHDYIMWIDADLVEYPANLINMLYASNPGGVTAPSVLIEGSTQFYDTYGYIENGQRISHIPPYFKTADRLAQADCVGCAYLIPASVYRFGARYYETKERTEHESIMRVAREMGLKIVCNRDIVVYHADLPRYGLYYHGH